MTQQIFSFLKKYSVEILQINRLIVSAYVSVNKLNVINNQIIKDLIIQDSNSEEFESLAEFINIIIKTADKISIENLIELFEFVISPAEKEVNGAVYTPNNIREYITNRSLDKFNYQDWTTLKIADISCGCGGFFLTAATLIKERIEISYSNLYMNFFGVDVEPYSVERTKILLSLLAIENGEDEEEFQFNLFVANSLDFDWRTIEAYRENNGFDIIIGNPPYVGSSKISEESKLLLNNWSVTQTGKPDLYIPFFQIAIENLNENGILGYITVNNFYRSLNGRAFRAYMSNHRYSLKMIDFGSEQVFKRRSTYTCICFITKDTGNIQYIKSKSSKINEIKNEDFIALEYEILTDHDGWLLQNTNIASNIRKIEATGRSLGDSFNIKNGFATLKNNVFLLNVIKEDSEFYYTETKENNIFQIEKSICRDAIKPNTLKSEAEIDTRLEKLLFPYKILDSYMKIICESEIKQLYPYAYKYLLSYKDKLAERDKGKRTYDEWYAFGRSQAINIVGYKLLFPYIADYPHFVISDQRNLLFYNGYALVSDNMNSLKVVQRILRSKVFWYYIKYTSKPYGGNFFALAKNYTKNFGVIQLSAKQEKKLMELDSDKKIDNFLVRLYDITID